jgi:hypothetical protein
MTPTKRIQMIMETLRKTIQMNTEDLARGTATLDEVTKSNECCLRGLDELKKQLEIEQQMLNKKKPTS